jgi:hypothetical protein
MTETKRGRPTQAPDFEKVITAINEGKYDERILEIDDALENRRDHLKAQLRERVKKVFGADADVVINSHSVKENIFVQRAKERSRDIRSEPETKPELSSNYRVNPEDSNVYHLEIDSDNGMVSVSDMNGNTINLLKDIWTAWPIYTDDINETVPEPELDQSDVPLDRRGPIIGGMASYQMGN